MRIVLMATTLLLVTALPAGAADSPVSPESADQVIKPEIDRREVTVPRIRARDFEAGVFVGQYNAESFGVQPVYGARIGYHLSEDFFVELTLAKSSISDENFRRLGIPLFAEEVTDLIYYHLSAGVNLFPGEIFLGKGRAWGSSIYLAGGIGSTSFDTFDRITLNIGAGLRVLPSKTTMLRIDIRDHIYESDLLGENKFMQNLEVSGGFYLNF
jgi:outer membrane beta-barrel protein